MRFGIHKKRFLLLLLVCSTTLVFAGKEGKKEETEKDSLAKKEVLPFKIKLKYADALFETGNYYEAIDAYLELTNERPDNYYLLYQLGECNYMARDYVTAENWYEKVIEAGQEDAFPLLYYRYAQMLKMNRKFEEAKYAFAKFALRADAKYEARARKEIEACDFASKQITDSSMFKIYVLDSINTPYSEYAPYVFDGDLYFSSLNHETNTNDEKDLSHIYKATTKDSIWSKPQLLGEPFNNSEFHTGNCSFSPDGKRVYFTECTDKGEANIKCKIYLSVFRDSAWQEPIELSEGVNNSRSNNTHPTVAKGDGSLDVLYFASNREDGYGGYDIWYSEVNENGISTPPVNLGNVINTDDNEITPYYYRDKLYFSSMGHIGLGGYDVFVSTGKKNKWTKPVNMGYPLNSSVDDMYFTRGEAPKVYYVTSNRPKSKGLKSATCCDDIFRVKDLRIPKFAIWGEVYRDIGETGKDLVMGAKMEIRKVVNNEKVLIHQSYLVGETDYFFNLQPEEEYEFKFQLKDYFSDIFDISTKGLIESDTFHHDVLLTRIEKNKSYKLDKIYYEFGKATLSPDSRESLDRLYQLLIENPKIVLEIGSYTDSVGSAEYNLELSQQRAQACVDYLIKLGIKPKRLTAKGYGETNPIAPNTNPDGTDNEEGRKLNRRTEIKVIGELTRQGDKIIYEN